ncbi:MAG: competence/damage-inducible protein A [Peptoniphilus lacydonensis]|uniref:competence/damage-inducible protein A n=1 Tax=Peptoniphilus lacydonensis TaxID=1673725 RepID=UPI002590F993|nr:competence/damage-inducible protein A [Peptoniphilus lacydonensis]MDU2115584.1 competence/damage-inducible protein A [Peptoniphilus lacydonensis]MDU7301734.1 competence/damage-inducible protein A [Peptoniphilus lacydonensis]
MKASILTIGKEILIGSILNSNSKYISEKLTDIGIEIIRQVSVDDNLDEIVRELNYCTKNSDLIIISGGLGPTEDDITKEAVAKFLNRPIYVDEEEKLKMENRFSKYRSTMTPNNLKQVMLIEGSEKIENNWGVALGESIEFEGKKIILLPGPPNEMEPMLDFYLSNKSFTEDNIIVKSVDIIGLGESIIEDRIRKMNFDRNVSINTFAHGTYTEVKIIGKDKEKDILTTSIQKVVESLYSEFNTHVYSENNEDVSEQIVRILRKNNLKISFAESITGGMLSSAITDISGASKVMETSFVTYSNDSKNKNLSVSTKTLKEHGAISYETAYEMAKGIKNKSGSNIGVATTGEAGPNSSETEVGNVYTCIYFSDDDYYVKHYFFNGDRNKIRMSTVNRVLSQILFVLRKNFKE